MVLLIHGLKKKYTPYKKMYRLKFEELFPAKNVESKPIFLSCLV